MCIRDRYKTAPAGSIGFNPAALEIIIQITPMVLLLSLIHILNEDIREFLCRKGFLHIHDNQFAAPGFICLHAADPQMVGVIRIIPPSQIGVGPSHVRDRKSIGHGFPCHIAGMPAAAGFRAVIAAPKGKCQTL